MHRLLRALSACALVAACAPERVGRRPRTAPPVHAPPRAPAVLSLHFDERRPAWFLGQDVPVVTDVDVTPELVRENVDSDILKLGGRYYAYDQKHGASGPFAPPGGADWLGIDRGGAVWVARRDGAILRAADVDAALDAGGFQRVASEPGIQDFDVNGFHAVGAAGRELVVIDTRNEHVRRIRRPGVTSFDAVRVRSDGVIVAEGRKDGKKALLVGSSRGAWRGYPDWGPPVRTDDFVGGSCATLARDGVTWSGSALPAGAPYVLAAFDLDEYVVANKAVPALGRLSNLPAHGRPKPPKVCGGSHRTRAPRVKIGRTFGSGEACVGAAFVMGAIHPARDAARYHFGLLGDGSCPQYDALDWECAPGKPLTRRPHAGVIDRHTSQLRIAAVPRDCQPERMLSAGGVGLLLCKSDGGVRVEMLDRSGGWHRETDLAGVDPRRSTLEMASDGTMLIRSRIRSRWVDLDDRVAWVRRPVALGRANAWRRIDVKDLIELRAVPDGGVLGIQLEGAAILPETFSVVLVSPGNRRTLARRVTIVGSLDDFDLVGSTVALWVSNELDFGPCGCEPMPGMPSAAPLFVLTQAGTLRATHSSKPIAARRTCSY